MPAQASPLRIGRHPTVERRRPTRHRITRNTDRRRRRRHPIPPRPPTCRLRPTHRHRDGGNEAYRPPAEGGYSGNGGFGQPYAPPPNVNETRPYASGDNAPPPYRSRDNNRGDGTFSTDEIKGAGHQFFGSISQGLASVIEHAFRKQGRPNGYILGEDAGGAFIAGLRYGKGTLYTKDAGSFPIYWQGRPSASTTAPKAPRP